MVQTPAAAAATCPPRRKEDHRQTTGTPAFVYDPMAQIKCKETFKGTLDENVVHFLDLFVIHTTLARLTDADCLLLLPTCLADRAGR